MNLADYLSELLGQHDEVSVPGLGYFVRERISGYYNEKESKFYPPYHQVKFVSQPKDDDIFTQYVADQKNISLASSKYFAEKFTGQVKEQAANGKYLFADLGSFQTEQDQLVFKAYDKIAANDTFYGYAPVDITRLSKPHGGDIKSVYAAAPVAPMVIDAPIQNIEQQEYTNTEPELKKPFSIWIVILIIITIAAIALMGLYKFYPASFSKITNTYNKITGKKEDTIIPVYRHEIKADTIKKTAPANDTTTKAPVAVASETITPAPEKKADPILKSRFEVIIGSFKNYILANSAVKIYKDKGIQAKILNLSDAPGPYIKVSAGTFSTKEEADSARNALVNKRKILPSSYPIEIKP